MRHGLSATQLGTPAGVGEGGGLGWIARAWLAFWRWRSINATIKLLGSLDDHMLKDIGLDRSEIDSIAYTQGLERVNGFDVLAGQWRRRR